jgi:hypothetical protein
MATDVPQPDVDDAIQFIIQFLRARVVAAETQDPDVVVVS